MYNKGTGVVPDTIALPLLEKYDGHAAAGSATQVLLISGTNP